MLKIKRLILGPAFTNTYIVWDSENGEGMVIDPADDGDLINKIIEKENLKIKFIVITHGHFDHVGGVEEVKKFTSAPVVLHSDDLETLKSVPLQAKIFGLVATAPPSPDRLLNEGEILRTGSFNFKVIHTPGHSPGSISLYSPQGKILFTGDALFRRSIGRTDLQGGDLELLISSIKNKLFPLPEDTEVYPGHEAPTTIGEEKRHNPFLQEGGVW
jgi:hydroxyacylglutathione hydrolase